jgi:uncharacterized membrane protein (DUF4010 family)
MKAKKILLLTWVLMLILAVGFILYAANHPEGNFPWSLSTTHTIYRIYLAIMASCFAAWLAMKIYYTRSKRGDINKIAQ